MDLDAEPVSKKAKLAGDTEPNLDDNDNDGFGDRNHDDHDVDALNMVSNAHMPVDDANDLENCVDDDEHENSASIKSASTQSAQPEENSHYQSEKDVGITCYICKGFDPIPGVLKQRFSDFVVNEIDTGGQVIRLKSTTVTCNNSVPSPGANNGGKELDESRNEARPLSCDDMARLEELVTSRQPNASLRLKAPEDKMKRKEIHLFIKSRFPALCSNCIEIDGVKHLDISHGKGNRQDRRQADTPWPPDHPHLHFTLYKEFKDTIEALDIISKYSGIKPHQFCYAGTKDKRAKTTQLVSILKVDAAKMAAINSRLRGIIMGDFAYKSEPVRLGMLGGNQFQVLLRNVNTSESNLAAATEAVRETGFVNYFGMQRFGTTTIPTYEVGKLLLKGDWLAAVDLIMAPKGQDKPCARAAREKWCVNRDAAGAMELLPRSCNIERRLMMSAAMHGHSHSRKVLEGLPRTTRLLYLHSFQSFLWNRIASRRIEELGLHPRPGDLVYMSGVSDQKLTGQVKPEVKVLSQADLSSYSIYDVVLPLPGCSVTLPDNEVKNWIMDMLKEDSLTLESFRTKQKEYRLTGSYRHLIVKPSNISSRLTRYDDVTQDLLPTSDGISVETIPLVDQSGKHAAAIFQFCLPPSSYATMVLREIMRTDTSAHHQTSLNCV